MLRVLVTWMLGLLLLPGVAAKPAVKGNTVLLISQDLSAHVGQTLGVYGVLSERPGQHLIDARAVKAHQVGYLQLDDGEQIVVYLPRSFAPCPAPLAVKLTGRVLAVHSGPQRPELQKADPGFTEHQLQVTEAACLAANSPESWLRDLGLSSVSLAHKQDALDQLSNLGEQVMPLLIGHVADQRLYGIRKEVPAAAINAPPGAPAAQPLSIRIPVSQVCQNLIYTLIAPEYISPYAGQFKPFSSSLFLIRDWSAWWQAHQHQSLSQIRKSLEPRVDDFWRQHGTVQVLD